MAPKRVNYGKFALQASLIFAAGHAARLTYSGNPSADWPAFVLSVAAWGLMGAAFVAVFAVIHVKIVLPNPSKEKSRKLLILGITLMVLAFAWFIPMLDQAGRWFPDPDIADRVIIWPFLILAVLGAAFVAKPLGKWFRHAMGLGDPT